MIQKLAIFTNVVVYVPAVFEVLPDPDETLRVRLFSRCLDINACTCCNVLHIVQATAHRREKAYADHDVGLNVLNCRADLLGTKVRA